MVELRNGAALADVEPASWKCPAVEAKLPVNVYKHLQRKG